MQSRSIGSLQVSVVGLGCNNFGMRIDSDATAAVVGAALDVGINLFDTADVYGQTESEVQLGQALGRRRDEAVIATKFGMPIGEGTGGAAPSYVRRAVDASLQRLGTDRIDLYQLHRPDDATPIADTLAALDELVRAGKVREIGCSNFTAAQLREADVAVAEGAARFASVQNHLNVLNHAEQEEVLAECARLDVAMLPYFPLASGLLTGKYRRGEEPGADTRFGAIPRLAGALTDENLDRVERLRTYAEERERSLVELAIAWLIAEPAVASVIAGATSEQQVRDNALAHDWALTPDEVAEVAELAS